MQEVCKYYIEISRYRDACGFIREGMDLTQLHFSPRRISLFLLHQVNADLVASCTNEATSRLKIAERFINSNGKQIVLDKKKKLPNDDIYNLKNFVYFNFLTLLKETKYVDSAEGEQSNRDKPLEETLFKRVELIKFALESNHQINEFCKDILVEIYFLVYSYLKQKSSEKYKTQMSQILKWIENILLKTKESKMLASYFEKWQLAELHCCAFEADQSIDHLKKANDYIKINPHPTLYRRICFNLFKVETDIYKKVMHLLETQSIALRHKACAIQIKQKRKSNIELPVFEKLTSSLSFNSDLNSEYLSNFIKHILPDNSVVVALVLNNVNDLFIVRLERNTEPDYYQLKYDQKYNENFKQIMLENDLSMKQSDRNKYWNTRNILNKRLNTFLEELEADLFRETSKALLLGSYVDYDMQKLIASFKKDLKASSLSESQTKLLKIIFLGIEHLTNEEISKALKREFSENLIVKYSSYLMGKKSELASRKRKHVCLLIDKVKYFSK